MGSGDVTPRFLNLGTTTWVVSFPLRPLYPRWKRPLNLLNRKLMAKRKIPAGNPTPVVHPVT